MIRTAIRRSSRRCTEWTRTTCRCRDDRQPRSEEDDARASSIDLLESGHHGQPINVFCLKGTNAAGQLELIKNGAKVDLLGLRNIDLNEVMNNRYVINMLGIDIQVQAIARRLHCHGGFARPLGSVDVCCVGRLLEVLGSTDTSLYMCRGHGQL